MQSQIHGDKGFLRADRMSKIMIVDDEYLIRYSLSSVFREPGTEVFAAADAKTAFETIQNNHVDLCFLDIQLPDMNGLEIMRRFHNISPWTRIVIITGSVLTTPMMQSIHENAQGLISKPFDLEQVKAVARRMLTKGGPLGRPGLALNNDESSVQWIADDYR